MWYTAWHAYSMRLTLSHISGEQSPTITQIECKAPTHSHLKKQQQNVWNRTECNNIIVHLRCPTPPSWPWRTSLSAELWFLINMTWKHLRPPLGPPQRHTDGRARSANQHISCIIKTLVPTEQREGHFRVPPCYKTGRDKPMSDLYSREIRVFTHTHTHTYIHTRVCVRVCERERDRERDCSRHLAFHPVIQ